MRFRRLTLALAVPALVVLALGACGSDEPSVQTDPVTSTTGESTTTSSAPTTSTTAPTPSDVQVVRFGNLQFSVPAAWPVHDLAADPSTCVRLDQHAVFLGRPGPRPSCPARLVGHIETLVVQPLGDGTQADAARATQPGTVNGLPVRIDPNPDANGALTVVFVDQNVLVILSYGDGRAVADAILASATLAS